jgi:RNA polymerase sigma factor (sigma-70 family)
MTLHSLAVREFVSEHRDLVLKHARAYVRKSSELIPAEDVAREVELELAQLAQQRGVDPKSIASPDALLRAMVKHAAGRAKRRRKLVEQIAAGDDLQAVSEDLAALDADLTDARGEDDDRARAARAALDKVKAKLSPRDALIFALLVEDEQTSAEVAAALSLSGDAVENARARVLEIAGREPSIGAEGAG